MLKDCLEKLKNQYTKEDFKILISGLGSFGELSASETLLMLAIEQDNLDGVKLLLEYEAEVNVKNEEGLTALDVTAIKENTNTAQIKKLLEEKGAKRGADI